MLHNPPFVFIFPGYDVVPVGLLTDDGLTGKP